MTMPRLGAAILRLATGAYTITRYAASTFANGRHTPGATSQFSIQAVIVPLSDRDLQRLPEGERSIDRIVLLTQTALQTAKGGAGGFLSDVITYKAVAYEIEQIDTWDAGGYYRCVARKMPL